MDFTFTGLVAAPFTPMKVIFTFVLKMCNHNFPYATTTTHYTPVIFCAPAFMDHK